MFSPSYIVLRMLVGGCLLLQISVAEVNPSRLGAGIDHCKSDRCAWTWFGTQKDISRTDPQNVTSHISALTSFKQVRPRTVRYVKISSQLFMIFLFHCFRLYMDTLHFFRGCLSYFLHCWDILHDTCKQKEERFILAHILVIVGWL